MICRYNFLKVDLKEKEILPIDISRLNRVGGQGLLHATIRAKTQHIITAEWQHTSCCCQLKFGTEHFFFLRRVAYNFLKRKNNYSGDKENKQIGCLKNRCRHSIILLTSNRTLTIQYKNSSSICCLYKNITYRNISLFQYKKQTLFITDLKSPLVILQ